MHIYQVQKDMYTISTDKSKLDIAVIHNYLSKESYWAKNIPVATVMKSIEGSYCFGVYEAGKQIGFARVITDCATFGWIADVFILEAFRGRGLSKWLMETIMACPELQDFRRWMLATKDAHGLYEKFGFKLIDNPERFMRCSTFTEYPVS
jgi:GNAT superfamily N-acetyltransferase